MDQITITDGGEKMRYTRREDDPFMWDIEIKFGRRWVKLPRTSEAFDGQGLLWSLTALVQKGVAIYGD